MWNDRQQYARRILVATDPEPDEFLQQVREVFPAMTVGELMPVIREHQDALDARVRYLEAEYRMFEAARLNAIAQRN